MEWIKSISKIYVINLDKREDRLLDITGEMEKYSIPFERVEGIVRENGAEGLRDTMIELFVDATVNKLKCILVIEDDCYFCEDHYLVHDTMNKVMEQLPENYHICFLGCQPAGGFTRFHSANLLPVQNAYSTHAVLYSYQGMMEILSSDLQSPIDNHYVKEIEPKGHSYCTFPLLCSQRAGMSDIGKAEIDWNIYIVPEFQKKLNEMRNR